MKKERIRERGSEKNGRMKNGKEKREGMKSKRERELRGTKKRR